MLGFFSGRIRRSATVAGGSDTPIELPEHNHDDAVMLVGPDEKIEPKGLAGQRWAAVGTRTPIANFFQPLRN
jgi:hypothetical protein